MLRFCYKTIETSNENEMDNASQTHTHTIWGKMWTLNQYGENSQRSRDVKEDERRAEQ